MLCVKDNYKSKYKNDLTCRKCKKETETQDHVLQICNEIHKDASTKVSKNEIFSTDVNSLRKTAEKIMKVVEILEKGPPKETPKRKKNNNKRPKTKQ